MYERFECWVPDRGQSCADAEVVRAASRQHAAEVFAEEFWSDESITPADLRVAVRREGLTTPDLFDVTPESSVVYRAYPAKEETR